MTVHVYDVRWLQRALASLGHYTGEIDGISGPKTRNAIVAFKISAGMRPRPFVGPITLQAIEDRYEEEERPRFGFGRSHNVEPPWMVEISKFMGLHEIRDNAVLREWLLL